MESVTIVLMLMVAVVISGIVARMVPVPLPRPLFQIALGALIGLIADWRVTLDPEIFFLLFLPPLLFLDGWRIPREELFKDGRTVLGLALGLVVFTVVGMGFFIHWMIPSMPLPVAFALAAVISPTDPIAGSAIAQRVPIPKRMMHMLEGEALLKNASGLVCLRFAIAAALTGAFSLQNAALNFLWVALGGIAVGTGVTWLVTRAKSWVVRHYSEEGGSQILISVDSLWLLPSRGASALLGHPRRGRVGPCDGAVRNRRRGRRDHPHPSQYHLGHHPIRRQRHHLCPSGRAIARAPFRSGGDRPVHRAS